jgi:hypothetical protein
MKAMRFQVMRRVFGFLMLAWIGSVPLSAATRPVADEPRESAAAPVAVQRISVPATGMRDEAAMVLVGTALIGLAAAVRRAA